MYLARLAPGRPPVVTQVTDDEGYLRAGKIILRARRPWARKTKDGAGSTESIQGRGDCQCEGRDVAGGAGATRAEAEIPAGAYRVRQP